jgi:ketosteroid isomerase-like protein
MTEPHLADRAAIADLAHAYCRALDEMDLGAIPALFSEDCIVSYAPRLESRSAARLAEDLVRLWRWRRTSHHLSDIIVGMKGDRAEAESCVLARHEAPHGRAATLFGQYRDRLVRTAQGWCIASRTQSMNGNGAGFTVAIHRLPCRPQPEGRAALDMSGR